MRHFSYMLYIGDLVTLYIETYVLPERFSYKPTHFLVQFIIVYDRDNK